jgi:hypothetical protein
MMHAGRGQILIDSAGGIGKADASVEASGYRPSVVGRFIPGLDGLPHGIRHFRQPPSVFRQYPHGVGFLTCQNTFSAMHIAGTAIALQG